VQDIVIEIQKLTNTARAFIAMGTEAILLEVPAFTVALEATGLEIIRTFKTALAAFAIVLAERTLLGEILSVLAPIIHVKTCFAMCAALRLARVVFDGAEHGRRPLDSCSARLFSAGKKVKRYDIRNTLFRQVPNTASSRRKRQKKQPF